MKKKSRYKRKSLRNVKLSEFVHLCKTNLDCYDCPLYINGHCVVHWLDDLEKNFHRKITIKYVYYYEKKDNKER